MMVLVTYQNGFYLPPPQFPLPLEVCPQYLPDALVLVVVLSPVGVACRGLPAGLRFGPFVTLWIEIGDPWLLGTTSEFYFTTLSIDLSTIMT